MTCRTILASLTCIALTSGCGGNAGNKKTVTVNFPDATAHALKQLAKHYGKGPILSPSVGLLGVGKNRFGFGLFTIDHRFVSADGVVIYTQCGKGKVGGPFVAREESLAVDPTFESETSASDPDSAKAVDVADISFKHRGSCTLLALVAKQGKLTATRPVGVSVTDLKSGPPQMGDSAIKIDTPTKASAAGDLSKIDTRVPPDTMHDVNFADALGKKPIVLVFATPALCQSRVCGPVVDITEEVKAKFGSKVDFIHMEIYKDNDLNKGFRPQVGAWRLPSEPWVFVIGKDGKIAERFEGAVSVRELTAAVQKVAG